MTDASHLDDDSFSAVLDGEPAPAHVRGCATCSVRLAELRRAVDAVAMPPPALTDARRRSMLERALASHAADESGMADDERPERRPVPLRRSNMARWSGIAAVLVVLIGIGALVAGRGEERPEMTNAESTGAGTAMSADAADESPAVDGGDLGARSDPAELGALIRDSVAAGASATLAAPAPAAATADDAAGAEARARSGLPCRTDARAEFGDGLGALVYGALVEWDGVPAVVLAYEAARPSGDGKVTYLGLVLARDDCRTLTSIFQTS